MTREQDKRFSKSQTPAGLTLPAGVAYCLIVFRESKIESQNTIVRRA